MTNYAELIAEAEKWGSMEWPDPIDEDTFASAQNVADSLIDRLAAAVRKLAPPEGWEVVRQEYQRDGFVVDSPYDGKWRVLLPNGDWATFNDTDTFPTASAAMAALDGENK